MTNAVGMAISEKILASEFNEDDISPIDMTEYVKVFLNGNWIGVTKKAVDLYNILKIKKMKNDIDKTTSITLDYFGKSFNIFTDAGRMYRPLLKVENNKLALN